MKKAAFLLITFATLVSFGSQTFGQDIRNTENSVDNGKRSSLTVDPITQALQLQIPLASYAQRGGSLPVMLSYSSKVWQIKFDERYPCYPQGIDHETEHDWYRAVYARNSKAGWTSSLDFPYFDYEPGIVYPERYFTFTGQPTGMGQGMNSQISQVARKILVMPDGSRHELRKDDDLHAWNATLGGKYYAVDGSRMVYDSDAGTLYLPDGSRFIWGSPGVFIDRNGNKTVYGGTAHLTDTIGRTIDDPISSTSAGDGSGAAEVDHEYKLPGLGSGELSYEMRWRKLSTSGVISEDETDSTLKYRGDWTQSSCSTTGGGGDALFHSYEDSSANQQMNPQYAVFDPVVLHEIELPNGQVYKFKYNVYGEISKIIYPTGGYERFTYGEVIGASGWWNINVSNQANRGVIERHVSPDGTSGSEVQYSYANPSNGTRGVTNPDGTKTEYGYYTRQNEVIGYGFDNPLYGRVYEVRQYSSTGDLMSRKLTEWKVDGTVVSGSGHTQYKTRDPRVVREISVVFEPGTTNALASMTTTEYDSNSDPEYFAKMNVKRIMAYDYLVVPASSASTDPLSTIAIEFSGSYPAAVNDFKYLYDANYKVRNMNSLVTESRVLNPANLTEALAKSQFVYDETLNYPILSAGTHAQWQDPSTNYRGNVTTKKSWHDITGNQSIETHAQYDNFGNLRQTWYGNGNTSQIEFSSTYGYAYPTKSTSPVPGGNGATTAFETTAAYDFNTGLTTKITDPNGLETRMEYNDSLLRPTKVYNYYGGSQVGAATETSYGAGTSASTLWVKSKSQIDETNWKEGYIWLDGLGRPIRTQSVDDDGDIFALTCYDNMGRVSKATNPFRGYTGQTCSTTTGLDWTTSTFDSAGRPWKVTTSDNAVVETTYGLAASGSQIGSAVTVQDQADKKRRSISNALGQLVRVDEPDPDPSRSSDPLGAVSSPNQPTTYGYDLLNNLTSVQQNGTTSFQCTATSSGSPSSCAQSRSFTYDAISRLKQATNPESGTINYTYDANSNLATKIDARSITTTYTYDRLNRVTLRAYTGEPSGSETPDVSYFYDNLTNAKGKLIKVSSSVSTTEYTSFDILGRVTASNQTTDGATYGNGTTDSPMTYTYNLSGALIEQQYPSGRKVQNALDASGDLSAVKSKKNAASGPFHNYAFNFIYNTAGGVTSMELGNFRYESRVFNSRLQPTQIALGSTANATDLLKLNYSYNTTGNADNNGNVLSQTITVPTVGTNNGFAAIQSYSYDSLNRLKDATESLTPTGGSATESWKQSFSYDRYGNRNFKTGTGETTTLGSCAIAVCNPSISPSNNKITATGYTFDGAGNTTFDAALRKFTYDAANKQIKVESTNSSQVVTGTVGEYSYDGDGKRVKKFVPDTGELTIFVYDAAGKLIQEHSTIVAASNDAKVAYLTNDHLGSPRINTDANGAVISRHDYHPFGEEIATSQRVSALNYTGDNVRKQVTGYERDGETELDFAQARYHNSALGRFSSADPIGGTIADPQSLNRYTYVMNNPLNYVDPTGTSCKDADKKDGDKCMWVTNGDGLYDSMWSSSFKKGNDLFDQGYFEVRSEDVQPFVMNSINNNDANPINAADLRNLRGQLVELGENGEFVIVETDVISVDSSTSWCVEGNGTCIEQLIGQDLGADSLSLSIGAFGLSGQGKLTRNGVLMRGYDANVLDTIANPVNIVKLARSKFVPSASVMASKTLRWGRISAADRTGIESGTSFGIGGGYWVGGQIMYVPSTGDVTLSIGLTTPTVYLGGGSSKPATNVPTGW